MVILPLNHERYIKEKGIMLVTSSDKKSPIGLFSNEIFGVTDEEKYVKDGIIPLNCTILTPNVLEMFNRIHRKIYTGCTDSNVKMRLTNGIIDTVSLDYEPLPNEQCGIGPAWLYTVWDFVDKKIFVKTLGTESNKELALSIYAKTKDNLFTRYQWVLPIGFREEDQDSMIISNEVNEMFSNIIRYSNLLSTNIGFKRSDIEVRIQQCVLDLYRHFSDKDGGPKGKWRKSVLSKSIDNASRMTLLPQTFDSKFMNNTRYSFTSTGMPLHHLLNNFRDTFIKFSKSFIDTLFEMGYLGSDSMVVYFYDNEFWEKYIDKMKDPYVRVSPFPVFDINGDTTPLMLDFVVYDENPDSRKPKDYIKIKEERKYLSFIEFFYIVAEDYIRFQDNTRHIVNTRYPTDSELSSQVQSVVVLTLTSDYIKTVEVLDRKYELYYPYVDNYVIQHYDRKIFEQANRNTIPCVTGFNGDFDGDSTSQLPINSSTAQKEAETIKNSLLNIFDFNGNFARSIGKDGAQTMYTFTRDIPSIIKSKTVPITDDFIKYLFNITNGQLDTDYFQEMTCGYYDTEKKTIMDAKYNIYDTIVINHNGTEYKTTIGRYILQKVIFYKVFDTKYYKYENKTMCNSDIINKFSELMQLAVESKIKREDLKYMVDSYSEFGFRFSTLYNSTLNEDMVSGDAVFDEYRNRLLEEMKNKVKKENRDISLLDMQEFETNVLNFAKEHFKDNQMYEMFISKNNAKWDIHFKSMCVTLGGLPKVTGENVIITNNLFEGIELKNLPDLVNIAMSGAVNRGLDTALGGTQYKDISNALQSVYGIKGDCGSTEGMKTICDTEDYTLLLNRYVIDKNKNVLITTDNVFNYTNKEIILRDPSKCKQKEGNFCSHCLGILPFELTGRDKVEIGLFTNKAGSNVMNMFMKATHSMQAKLFKIDNLNDFLYEYDNESKRLEPLFTHTKDDEGKEIIIVNYDTELVIPESGIEPEGTSYTVMAHGAVLTIDKDNDNNPDGKYAFVLGTEITTSPVELIKPSSKENEYRKHYILKYPKGSVFMNDVYTRKKERTTFKMLNMFLRGTASNMVPLETHMITLHNTFKSNMKLATSDLILNIIIYSLARDLNDPHKTVRETGSKDYKFVSTTDLTTLTNTTTGLLGGDVNRSLSIASSKNEKEQTRRPSPIEKVLRY